MNQDEIIDALAFGAATQKIGNCLGMYLGPEVIYIAETHLEKGKLAVDHLVRIPVPSSVLSHDYQVVPLAPDAAGKARQGALVAVTQKKNLANIAGLLQSLGLRLVGMEVAPCSALRLFESLDKPSAGKTHCQVH